MDLLPSLPLLYMGQEVTQLALRVDSSSLRGGTIAIVCVAEGALWLDPALEPRGETELLFIPWRAQDGAWHWTQNQQAVERPLHTPKHVHVCAHACIRECVCVYVLCVVFFCPIRAPARLPTN